MRNHHRSMMFWKVQFPTKCCHFQRTFHNVVRILSMLLLDSKENTENPENTHDIVSHSVGLKKKRVHLHFGFVLNEFTVFQHVLKHILNISTGARPIYSIKHINHTPLKINMEATNPPFCRGKSSSKPSLLCSMWVFPKIMVPPTG